MECIKCKSNHVYRIDTKWEYLYTCKVCGKSWQAVRDKTMEDPIRAKEERGKVLPGMEDWARARGLIDKDGYLKPEPKGPIKNGYWDRPGTGPEGETCKTCTHKTYQGGVAGRYIKCARMQDKWTGGEGTDILARAPACSGWEPKRKE